MSALDIIKAKIGQLYQTNPVIHVNVSLTRPRLTLTNSVAKIVAIYPHTFQIEENISGEIKRHTLQYTDILIKNVVVLELEDEKA